MGDVVVGTCGYGYYRPPDGWKERYESKLQAFSHVFPVVELNRTFYRLPMVRTARRWRREASAGFVFTVKAWQALTHPASSPTWRKHRDGLTERQREHFGYLRPHDEVVDAWRETKKRAEALEAPVCLLQTPASFDCTDTHEDNMRTLLNRIERDGIDLAWEPRGDWKQHPERVRDICNDLDLIHVVDIMRRKALSGHPTAYIRLHGLNEDEYDYDYDYTPAELEEIAGRVFELADDHDRVYCLFNNFEMYENARCLMDML
ncbi:MAG: DUF72 domain-containing protein [Thermoplasmatota archaeon]